MVALVCSEVWACSVDDCLVDKTLKSKYSLTVSYFIQRRLPSKQLYSRLGCQWACFLLPRQVTTENSFYALSLYQALFQAMHNLMSVAFCPQTCSQASGLPWHKPLSLQVYRLGLFCQLAYLCLLVKLTPQLDSPDVILCGWLGSKHRLTKLLTSAWPVQLLHFFSLLLLTPL